MEEEYIDSLNQEEGEEIIENNPQYSEEDLKIFESKYDNEFIGLLNEIGNRMNKFNKYDKVKIKSWINILSIPCETDEAKKNRNLYGIKLINQMINGKLDEPFIRNANSLNDLVWLSPIDIKAELSKKFYDEIDFEEIENFGIQQQKKFLGTHPDIANKIKAQNNSKKYSPDYNNDNKYNNKYNNNGQFNTNVNNSNNKIGSFSINNNKISMKNYNDKVKLINIIRDLEQKVAERDEIIEFQNKQIEQIENRINFIQSLENQNSTGGIKK